MGSRSPPIFSKNLKSESESFFMFQILNFPGGRLANNDPGFPPVFSQNLKSKSESLGKFQILNFPRGRVLDCARRVSAAQKLKF